MIQTLIKENRFEDGRTLLKKVDKHLDNPSVNFLRLKSILFIHLDEKSDALNTLGQLEKK